VAYKFNFSVFSTLNPPITKSSQITEALFSVFCGGGTQGTEKTYVYRITKEWILSEACWMECKKGERWNPGVTTDSVEAQGGLFTLDDGAETAYAAEGAWESYTVTGIIKKFIDGTPNYGLILVNDYKGGHTGRSYVSSEYQTDKSWRPKLTIKYGSIGIISSQTINRQKGYTIIQTADMLKIYAPFKSGYIVELVDVLGRNIVLHSDARTQCHQIPVRSLCNGVYLIRILAGNKKFQEKLIIVK